MGEGIILATIAIILIATYWLRARWTTFDRRQEEVLQVIADAGYAAFGPTDGYTRTFQSRNVAVRVEWERGYVSAFFERRDKSSGWVSERVLREALFHEVWDPAAKAPCWDSDDIASRLRDRLAPMARAIDSDDPDLHTLLLATRAAQTRRWDEYLASVAAA